MTFRTLPVLVTACILALFTSDVVAQNYYQTSRSFVRTPHALGMGDAGVAFSTRQGVFFQNPAHLSQSVGLIPRITIAGVQGSLSTTVFDQVRFYRNRVNPKIQQGLDTLSDGELRSLYDDAFAVGRQHAFVNGDVILPSVMLRIGSVALGAGAFVHSQATYRFGDAGLGIPILDFAGRVDAIAVGSAAVDLSYFGISGLSGGLSAKYTRRHLTMKEKPLDTISRNEPVLLFTGNSVGIDLGVLYDLPLLIPGQVTLGGAVYDMLAIDFDYSYRRSISDTEPSAQTIEAETLLAQERFGLSKSYRVGAAYTIPSLGGLLGETGIALDYVGYQNPTINQTFLAGVHLGAQARLAGLFTVRTGLSQGYASIGAGVGLGPVQLNYALFGVEEGRLPGQVPGWNHLLQVRVGL